MDSNAKPSKTKQGQGQGRQQAKQGCVERVSRVERRNAITSTNKAAAVHPMGSPSSALQPSVPAVPCERAGEDQGLAQAPPSAADHSTGAGLRRQAPLRGHFEMHRARHAFWFCGFCQRRRCCCVSCARPCVPLVFLSCPPEPAPARLRALQSARKSVRGCRVQHVYILVVRNIPRRICSFNSIFLQLLK